LSDTLTGAEEKEALKVRLEVAGSTIGRFMRTDVDVLAQNAKALPDEDLRKPRYAYGSHNVRDGWRRDYFSATYEDGELEFYRDSSVVAPDEFGIVAEPIESLTNMWIRFVKSDNDRWINVHVTPGKRTEVTESFIAVGLDNPSLHQVAAMEDLASRVGALAEE
jgi:hypothetical protein